MTLRWPVLCSLVLVSVGAPAVACPLTAIRADAARIELASGHDLAERGPALWSHHDVVDMDIVREGGHEVLVARRPLEIGGRYALVVTRDEHGFGLNRAEPLGPMYLAVETLVRPVRPVPPASAGLLPRLALFGLLPFAGSYLAVSALLARRRRAT